MGIVRGMEAQTRMISSTSSMLLNSEMKPVNNLEKMVRASRCLSPHVIQTPSILIGRLKATKLYPIPIQTAQSRGQLSKLLKSGTNLIRIKSRDLLSLERNLCISHSILWQLPPSTLSDSHNRTHPERAFKRCLSSPWRSTTLIPSSTISSQRPMLTLMITLRPEASCSNPKGVGRRTPSWGTTQTRLRGMERHHRTSLRQERATS
jgi:hypothetical protein